MSSLQKLSISLAHLLLILCHDRVVESRSRVVSKTGSLPFSSSAAAAGACTNCTICQYPCHTSPLPPPPQEYPLYGVPPPPPPPPVTGYPVLGAPPPPLPVQGNCPPGQFAACCQYAPPIPYGYAPPIPYGYAPPHPYGYMPVDNHSAALAFFHPLLWLIVVVLCVIHNEW